MTKRPDYSLLDDPLWLQFVFHPRRDWTPAPAGAVDHDVPVDNEVSISCRMYEAGKQAPSILFFHGNGEVVSDYDRIAPLFKQTGANLFVADYRGYGRSGGQPSFSNAADDALVIFDYFLSMLASQGYMGPAFVMGRSLGSQPALDLAASCRERLKGLIIESGFAEHTHLMRYLGLPASRPELDEFDRAATERIGGITLPVLLIHANRDMTIPHAEAVSLYEALGSRDKELLTIDKAGHNDIMLVGMEKYFHSIHEFISRQEGTL